MTLEASVFFNFLQNLEIFKFTQPVQKKKTLFEHILYFFRTLLASCSCTNESSYSSSADSFLTVVQKKILVEILNLKTNRK